MNQISALWIIQSRVSRKITHSNAEFEFKDHIFTFKLLVNINNILYDELLR